MVPVDAGQLAPSVLLHSPMTSLAEALPLSLNSSIGRNHGIHDSVVHIFSHFLTLNLPILQ